MSSVQSSSLKQLTDFFDDLYVLSGAQFGHGISQHHCMKRELSRTNSGEMKLASCLALAQLTLTKEDHSCTPPLPARRVANLLGTFLMPFRWVCMASTAARLSAYEKQETASWRAVMTAISRDGRRSHWRRSALPSLVRVWSRIPGTAGRMSTVTCYRLSEVPLTKEGEAFLRPVRVDRRMALIGEDLQRAGILKVLVRMSFKRHSNDPLQCVGIDLHNLGATAIRHLQCLSRV